MLSKCKQVTTADVESGWNFSAPLADQIRRKNGSPSAIAQSGADVPSHFGIEGEAWTRLRWGQRWARPEIRGWSGRAVAKWFSWRKMQDINPKDACSVGVPNWYTEHQP